MRKVELILARYAEPFRCIGPACEDSCCNGWSVPIDRRTYKKYRRLPSGPLRTLLDDSVVRSPTPAAGAAYASVRLPPSRRCPMHTPEGLCQIQVERGAGYLSEVCGTFPRVPRSIDGRHETTLTLSCPEAARLVLTHPDLLAPGDGSPAPLAWDDQSALRLPLFAYFWPIRAFTIGLLRNRSYPLWQRMFLLGSFCRRLEALQSGSVEGGFAALEFGFSRAIAAGSLRASIETIPADLRLQLVSVLDLVRPAVAGGPKSPRLAECLDAFMEGIGRGESITLEQQCANYDSAYQRFYAPLLREHPHLLENFLLNTVLMNLFPFGKDRTQPAREYARLAVEFAVVKCLLIGAAGCYREAFSIEHVVRTVQVVVKHFEHNPRFLEGALHTLAAKRLDDARGLTLLLRN